MAFKDGLSDFLTTWSGVHTGYSFNNTNANAGTDSSHDANSSSYAQADTDNYPNYGLSANCSPDANGDMDIYIITDCCMLLYIPTNLATDEYALFHNGGSSKGQMGQIRSENNGETITLGITHNGSGYQDYTTKAITERGWVCLGFQFEDNSGNLAIWVNGVNVQEAARSNSLAYGSGNPKIGDGGAVGIPGWTALEEIDGTGMLIANFVCDNPNNDNSDPAGCGDSFYTDYYDAHLVEIPPTYKLEGITKDKNGDVLVSCECFLFKDNGDDTLTFVDHVTSDGATGAYSFTGLEDDDSAYLVYSVKDDTPHVFDVTDHVLTPVEE
jgi:hypothetical protein